MSKVKTQKEFEDDVKKKYGNEYLVIGKYINAKTKIKFIHNKCNKEFNMTPTNFLNGQQCPFCRYKRSSKTMLISTDEFKKEVFNLVGDEYEVKSEYKGRLKNIIFHHNICGLDFIMTPNDFINKGHRCTNKECLHNRISYPLKDMQDKFKEKFEKRSNGEYMLLSNYTLSYNKILIKHLSCNNIFEMKANNFIEGQGCPYCNISKGELKIRNFCNNNFIEYIWQKSYNDLFGVSNGLLSYDFYFPKYNLLLEYQGQFHDGTLLNKCQTAEKLEIQQEHDRRKRQYAKDHNIKLLEIWYWDFDNIEEILDEELGLSA